MTNGSTRQRLYRFGKRRPFLSVIIAITLVFSLWVLYLNWDITRKFEGRRWDLPAQVYARPLELYTGLELQPDRFERELMRLGYRHIAAAPQQPGTFRRTRAQFELVTREFQFWDTLQNSSRMIIRFDGKRISQLTDGVKSIPIIRLDPLLVGSIFAVHGEDRLIVTPDDIPALLPDALKIVEDRRFEDHHGVDPVALARAVAANLSAGGITQGGSTLTQQLIKNYFLDNRQTLWRKFREAIMALIIELHYDKAEILNAYINEIYMGQDGNRAVHGFGLGSQFYFSKPLNELELHEIATLVALIRGPGYYHPRRYPERVIERRNLVLALMAEAGIITEQVADEASARALGIWNSQAAGASYYPAFLRLVREQLASQYKEEALTQRGLRVFTTLDPLIQADAERKLAEGLDTLEQSKTTPEKKLAGAVVMTSVQSGEVLAVVGDRRAGYEGFNRALDARRPIGSLIKPVVFLAAIESGKYSLASVVDDSEVSIELENGDRWEPGNFSGETYGPVTLVRALSESLNLATVTVGIDTGVIKVAELLKRLGADEQPAAYPSLLLGAVELSPIEVAQVYSTLANNGFHTPLRAVRSVIDEAGQPLQHYPIQISQSANPADTYQLNEGLVSVIDRGTGRSARSVLPAGLVAAGKTGTSDGFRDSWFAGFTGDHVAVVWAGYDDNSPTGLTGGSGALKIWSAIIANLGSSSYAPAMPASLKNRWIEYDTGRVSRARCKDVVELAVPKDLQLPKSERCGFSLRDVGEKTLEWLDGIID